MPALVQSAGGSYVDEDPQPDVSRKRTVTPPEGLARCFPPTLKRSRLTAYSNASAQARRETVDASSGRAR
jgi:hypothetical protein